MDRGIEAPPGEAKTGPSGTISLIMRVVQPSLRGYFPCRTMTQNLGRCFKVGLAEYAKTPTKTEMREEKTNRLIVEKEIYTKGEKTH